MALEELLLLREGRLR